MIPCDVIKVLRLFIFLCRTCACDVIQLWFYLAKCSFPLSGAYTRGQNLAFEYDGDETLSVKIFRADGGYEDCYVESDSSSRSSCYNKEDEDEDEEDSLNVKV